MFGICNGYCDVLDCAKPYPEPGSGFDPQMDAVLLHVINHCARMADAIKKNNERIKAAGPGGWGCVSGSMSSPYL